MNTYETFGANYCAVIHKRQEALEACNDFLVNILNSMIELAEVQIACGNLAEACNCLALYPYDFAYMVGDKIASSQVSAPDAETAKKIIIAQHQGSKVHSFNRLN